MAQPLSGPNKVAVKCVVVGDAGVGKTCLLIRYTTGAFPSDYIPALCDNYDAEVKGVNLSLWDTAGDEAYDKLRPMSYPGTDVFLVCFSIILKESFEHVESKWWPELKKHAPGASIILVGTKGDLRNNATMKSTLASKGLRMVSEKDAREYARRSGALAYIECSALTREGLDDLLGRASQLKARVARPSSSQPLARDQAQPAPFTIPSSSSLVMDAESIYDKVTDTLEGLFQKRELAQSLAGTEPSESGARSPAKFYALPPGDWLSSAIWSSAMDPRLFALSQQICLVRGGRTYEGGSSEGAVGMLAAEVIQRVAGNFYTKDTKETEAQYARLKTKLATTTTFQPNLIPDLLLLACAALDPLEPLLRDAYKRRHILVLLDEVSKEVIRPLSFWLDTKMDDLGPTPPTRIVLSLGQPVHTSDDGIHYVWADGRQVAYKFQCVVMRKNGRFSVGADEDGDNYNTELGGDKKDHSTTDLFFVFLELMST